MEDWGFGVGGFLGSGGNSFIVFSLGEYSIGVLFGWVGEYDFSSVFRVLMMVARLIRFRENI